MDGGPTAVSRSICAALACAVVCAFAPAAQAQSLHDLLFGRKNPSVGRNFDAPPVARYVSEDGDVFILDLSQDKPLLKFDGSPDARFEIQRILVDGDLAMVHVKASRPGAPDAAVADIYRFEDGRIVEHWDVLQPVPVHAAHDHPMF